MSKHEHIERARRLLESSDAPSLRYAALELRLAIESIVYAKLRLYAPRLPAAVLEKWQPPQAMKALTQIEPRAGHPFHLRVARQPGPGIPGTDWKYLGEHLTFNQGWLQTNYHKLGNFLHSPSVKKIQSGSTEADTEALRSTLRTILSEVERVSGSQIDGTLATVIEFQCAACDRPVFCNDDGVHQSLRATCLEASCGAEHNAEFRDDGAVVFYLDSTEFTCLRCKHDTPVENRKLKVGFEFACEACKAAHVFAEIHWGYALKIDPSIQGD